MFVRLAVPGNRPLLIISVLSVPASVSPTTPGWMSITIGTVALGLTATLSARALLPARPVGLETFLAGVSSTLAICALGGFVLSMVPGGLYGPNWATYFAIVNSLL